MTTYNTLRKIDKLIGISSKNVEKILSHLVGNLAQDEIKKRLRKEWTPELFCERWYFDGKMILQVDIILLENFIEIKYSTKFEDIICPDCKKYKFIGASFCKCGNQLTSST